MPRATEQNTTDDANAERLAKRAKRVANKIAREALAERLRAERDAEREAVRPRNMMAALDTLARALGVREHMKAAPSRRYLRTLPVVDLAEWRRAGA
jgi:hypothetical protein